MEDVKESAEASKSSAEKEEAEKAAIDTKPPPKKRGRKKKTEVVVVEAEALRHPLKRKRGRPRKNAIVVKADDGNGVAVAPTEPKPRKKKEIPVIAKPLVDPACVGKSVTGILDGSFDAGYLVTVRIADTNTVLRGVLFDPSITIPLSTVNDVAPGVKTVRKDKVVLPPPDGSVSDTPPPE